jgi:hypothetical protein
MEYEIRRILNNLRTWQKEALAAAAILSSVALLNGARAIDWLGAAAVLVTFFHMQVTSRLSEAYKTGDEVECHAKADQYLILKETLWLFYFLSLRAYPAILGVIFFMVYPYWRKYYHESFKS